MLDSFAYVFDKNGNQFHGVVRASDLIRSIKTCLEYNGVNDALIYADVDRDYYGEILSVDYKIMQGDLEEKDGTYRVI